MRSTFASGYLFASRLLRRKREKSLQVLTSQRDASLPIARYNDIVDKTGEWGNTADEEGNDSTPVGSVSGRVAVDAVKIIHVRYGHVAASDDIVAAARETD